MIAEHQSPKMKNDEWLTPPWILERLGKFDLDPCAPIKRPWDIAKHHYTWKDNGLIKEWFGRVWLNPPYGRNIKKWLYRLYKHGNGIALTFARTETDFFFRTVWGKCDGLLFVKGRLYFYNVDGIEAKKNSGAPSVLIAYGKMNAEILKNSKIPGAYIEKQNIIGGEMSDIFKLRLILAKIDELRELIEEWENGGGSSLRDLEAMMRRYYRKLEFHEKQQLEEKFNGNG